MGKESVLVLNRRLDVAKLLDELNSALSEEWLAYYQYWVGSFVIEGGMRADVQREFEEHAREEFEHAKMLANRIIQLEGVPVLDPSQWFDKARCKYAAPTQNDVISLLKQNISAERCAIVHYEEIANITHGIDYTTCDIAKRIMAQEEDHEQDLQDYLRDVEWVLQTACKC